MLVDFRPHARLRGDSPTDLGASLLPVVKAVSQSSAELERVRVVCDWIQYRNNFREVVEIRPILPGGDPAAPVTEALPLPIGIREDNLEIAVDVRRAEGEPLAELTLALLSEPPERVLLEEWTRGSQSCIWDFNALYWSELGLWENATGRGYEQALPGGESDARNRAAASELVEDLFVVWDRLAAQGALPEKLPVVELGVGNGNQAKVFLDEFREIDQQPKYGVLRAAALPDVRLLGTRPRPCARDCRRSCRAGELVHPRRHQAADVVGLPAIPDVFWSTSQMSTTICRPTNSLSWAGAPIWCRTALTFQLKTLRHWATRCRPASRSCRHWSRSCCA